MLPFSARPIRMGNGIRYGSKGRGLVYTDDHSVSGFTSDGYEVMHTKYIIMYYKLIIT